jgi:hypothetical protein
VASYHEVGFRFDKYWDVNWYEKDLYPATIMDDLPPSIARMRKRHTPKHVTTAYAEDGRRLLEQQSPRNAVTASLIAIIVFSVLWAMLSTLTNRIFPWMTMLLGIIIGLAVRRAGHGLDWRFPTIAAVATIVGAVASNIVVAAAFTARALETSTLTVLRAATSMTWPVFFDEAMTPADAAYALIGAATAAFYANRRLGRAEFLALRKWEDERDEARGD